MKTKVAALDHIKVIIGSKNPVKINATQAALALAYPQAQIECLGVNAPSGVADQPMTEPETLLGAENRVQYCQQHYDADFYVAIEGGVDHFSYGSATFAYIVIASQEQQSIGRSANLPLPGVVHQALEQGQELGDVMDKLFNTNNIKQKAGAMGLLTNDLATRGDSYQQALILAMAPFLHQNLFSQ